MSDYSAYRRQLFDEFIQAMGDYADAKQEWENTYSVSGFYDPCGEIEKDAKQKIEDCFGNMDKAFRELVLDTVDER